MYGGRPTEAPSVCIPKVLSECQRSSAAKTRGVAVLSRCRQEHANDFFPVFEEALCRIISAPATGPHIDRLLNVAADVGIQPDTCTEFTDQYLTFLATCTRAEDKLVRLRACNLLAQVHIAYCLTFCDTRNIVPLTAMNIAVKMGLNAKRIWREAHLDLSRRTAGTFVLCEAKWCAAVDSRPFFPQIIDGIDESFLSSATLDLVEECLVARMGDRVMQIRVLAARLLARFADGGDEEDAISALFVDALRTEKVSSVRMSLLECAPPLLDATLERTADADPAVRKQAFKKVAAIAADFAGADQPFRCGAQTGTMARSWTRV